MKNKLTFNVNWKTSLFVVIMFPILISLGFWQIDRAAEKRHAQEIESFKRNQPPKTISTLFDAPPSELSHLKVSLHGSYINDKNILIDNQMHKGRFGYGVITPFHLSSSEHTILVGRGWVQGSLDRSILPTIEPILGEHELVTRAYVPTRTPYLIGAEEKNNLWPKRVTFIDFDKFQTEFERPLFPFVLRLETGMKGSLERHWRAISGLKPENHDGYAFQWFALAATLLISYIAISSNIFSLIKTRRSR